MNIKNNDLEHTTNISNRFIWHACQQPDAIAIHHNGKSISYAELDKLSHSLAMHLLAEVNASQSTNSSQIIAIHGKRNANLIVSMIACARANLTFAVLDAAYPDSRIEQMLDLIQPQLIIGTDTQHNDFLALQRAAGKYPVYLPSDTSSFAKKPSQNDSSGHKLNHIAYLLFTSGTTGVPKCIKTSHAPLVHFVDWYIETFNVGRSAQFSFLSGLGHDPILRDIFVPLSAGASIHIPEQSIIINPVSLFDWFQNCKINYTHATPQLLKILCSATNHGSRLPNLKYVFSGGDALRVNQVQKLRSLNGDCQIVNFYGTTETPQAMAYYRVANDDSDPIPVGYPISDVHLHLLNDDLTHTKKGEMGQIAIETTFLSEGYVHDEAMTNGRFVHVPDVQDRVYLTGDYGMLREDDAMLLKGRVDDQIKIRGFRIELGEIVTALESIALVQTAVVLPKKADNGENYLIAYLVRERSTQLIKDNVQSAEGFDDIKLAIAKLIPSYMVPNFYIWIDRLPLLPNGKLDRAQLPDLHQGDTRTSAQVTAGSIEDSIIKQWKGLLGLADINPGKSFVELGGDSLSFIQASLSVEKVMGWIPDDWEKKSIFELAQLPVKKSSLISAIETPLFFRAVSIILIVMTHFTSIHISATHALFFISGISLGKFQLNQILTMADFSPIIKTIAKIALPTFIFILAIQLRHVDDIDLFNLFLI